MQDVFAPIFINHSLLNLFSNVCRQKSLPSASSEISLPETQLDWVDQLDIDGEKVILRKKLPASYESVEG